MITAEMVKVEQKSSFLYGHELDNVGVFLGEVNDIKDISGG